MKNVSNKTNRTIPALIAVGSSLASLPAGALELGPLTVQSRLGQPLRASIAYALAPHEQVSDYCVSLRPGASVSGLPGFGAASISVANGVIMLTGKTPVREPMVAAHVVVNCPYAANLSREYMLFIDPPAAADKAAVQSAYQPATVTLQTSAKTAPVAVTPAAVEPPVATVAARPVLKDINTATRYRVKPGDSLSRIAQRIENRSIGLWTAVDEIFAANPDAFMHNDPNQLKAGSWLAIPDFAGTAAVTAPQTDTETAAPVASDVAPYEAYEPTPIVEVEAATPLAAAPLATAEPVATIAPLTDMTNDLRPGDIILDTTLEGPTTTASSPNVPTAIITPRTADTSDTTSSSWLVWLAGSGIALIFGLLMIGRRLRGRTDTRPVVPLADQVQQRRFSDMQTTDTENIEALGVDHDLSDDSPTDENLLLDADLEMSTDIEQGAAAGDLQDFGFAATAKLDLELPFEPVAPISEETNMLPSLKTGEHSILESEVLPQDDDDYDMSVIVDATKMPLPNEVTEHDLQAVEIQADDDTLNTDNYTISKEVDFHIIEQDYEDELTATQALNEEIARAAIELATSTENDDDNETAVLPLATVTELDITAQMPAQNDEISDLEDTGINEEITVNKTAEEDTVEMPVESGKAS